MLIGFDLAFGLKDPNMKREPSYIQWRCQLKDQKNMEHVIPYGQELNGRAILELSINISTVVSGVGRTVFKGFIPYHIIYQPPLCHMYSHGYHRRSRDG